MSSLVESFVPLSDMMDALRSETFESIQSQKEIMADSYEETPPTEAEESKAHAAKIEASTKGVPATSIDQTSPAEALAHDLSSCQEPKVFIDKEGDRITKIRMLCGCGQSVVIDCQYDEMAGVNQSIEDSSD
jgi:hypothetical protein